MQEVSCAVAYSNRHLTIRRCWNRTRQFQSRTATRNLGIADPTSEQLLELLITQKQLDVTPDMHTRMMPTRMIDHRCDILAAALKDFSFAIKFQLTQPLPAHFKLALEIL